MEAFRQLEIAISERLNWLIGLGYVRRPSERGKFGTVVESHRIWFDCKKLNRRLLVDFQPFDVIKTEINFISVRLYRYSEMDYIAIGLLAEKHLRCTLYNEYLGKSMDRNFPSNLSNSLNSISKYLLRYGLGFLEGKEWEAGLDYEITDETWDRLYDEQSKKINGDS